MKILIRLSCENITKSIYKKNFWPTMSYDSEEKLRKNYECHLRVDIFVSKYFWTPLFKYLWYSFILLHTRYFSYFKHFLTAENLDLQEDWNKKNYTFKEIRYYFKKKLEGLPTRIQF